MPLVFVCETFARSGKHHDIMDGIPFIAHGAVEGSLFAKDGLVCLDEGLSIIAGEIYEVDDSRWEAFLFLVNKVSAPCKIHAKKISAQVRGLALECYGLFMA